MDDSISDASLRDLYESSRFDLDRVFSEGSAKPYRMELRSRLESSLRNGVQNQGLAIFPHLDVNNNLVIYLSAKNEQFLDEFLYCLKAHLGNCYTFESAVVEGKEADQFEDKLLKRTSSKLKKLVLYKQLDRTQETREVVYWVFDQVIKARNLFENRPQQVSSVLRPLGLILRNFFSAMNSSDESNARVYLEELYVHNRLSPRNYYSLELQLEHALGNYRAVLLHDKVADLTRGVVPKILQRVILSSIAESLSFDEDGCLLETSCEDFIGRFGGFSDLFRKPLSLSESKKECWNVWALGAAAFSQVRVLEASASSLNKEWYRWLRTWAGLSETKKVGQGEEDSNQFEIDALLGNEPSVKNIQKLMTAASAGVTNDQLKDLYNTVVEYPVDILEQAKSEIVFFAGNWETLVSQFSNQCVASSWIDWLKSIKNGTYAESNSLELRELAEDWEVNSWDSTVYHQELLSLSDSLVQGFVRDVTPVFLDWLDEHSAKCESDTLIHLISLVVSDESVDVADLGLVDDLIVRLLSQRHSSAQYEESLDYLDLAWEKIKSPRTLEGIIGVYETLIDYPSVNQEKRLSSWMLNSRYLCEHWGRIDLTQRAVVKSIATFLEGSANSLPKEPEREEKESSDAHGLDVSGHLAIYTLTEGAGKRAAEILKGLYPELKVSLSHDKSLTEHLDNLIKSADYFIFASRSAAHQAYYPVKKRGDVIYPDGKGSSSIVRAFQSEFVQ